MDTQRIHPLANQAALKEYYAKYLTEVRKVRDSTVKHYFDALSYISKYLKGKKSAEKGYLRGYGFKGTVSIEGNTIQRSRFHQSK